MTGKAKRNMTILVTVFDDVLAAAKREIAVEIGSGFIGAEEYNAKLRAKLRGWADIGMIMAAAGAKAQLTDRLKLAGSSGAEP